MFLENAENNRLEAGQKQIPVSNLQHNVKL